MKKSSKRLINYQTNLMSDVRQSLFFSNFMKDLGWQTIKIDHIYIYLRKLPLLGNFAKIPRPTLPINIKKIKKFIKDNNIYKLKIAPNIIINNDKYHDSLHSFINNNFKIDKSPFNPTTTILIDLTQSEQMIFNSLTEAKRRGVRKALKNNIRVEESSDINSFIKIRQQQYFPLGFLVTYEMKKLWQNFYPLKASLLLAYQNNKKFHSPQNSAIAINNERKYLAGILMLYYNRIAYYWFASSLKQGKKLFAPTLLVFEALKVAKKRGCVFFDFEGVYDERFPKAAESWKGFTKFKEGFGGKKIILCENLTT